MTKKIPAWLSVFDGGKRETASPRLEDSASCDRVCRSFESATGWQLDWRGPRGTKPQADGLAETPQLLLKEPAGAERIAEPPIPRQEAEELAAAVEGVLGELMSTRTALWRREAELAAGVPIRPRPDEEEHLAARLEAVIEAGTRAVGGHAAGLYLLDDATRCLKLRSSWGLPVSRLLEEPRPLRGAAADLEALVGHAVVLENARLLPHWMPPEEFASAVCVPVASPTTVLGTLWVFCREPREFPATQTDLLEIVSGRIAAELEREILLSEGVAARHWQRQVAEMAQRQRDRQPQFFPPVEGWQLAGYSLPADLLGGEFFDHCVLADGMISLALGDAEGPPLVAAAAAQAAAAALFARADLPHDGRQMLQSVGEAMYAGSASGQPLSLFYARLHPERGEAEVATAGSIGAVVVGPRASRPLRVDAPPLGVAPETSAVIRRVSMRPGDVLLAVSDGVLATQDDQGRPFDLKRLARIVRRTRHEDAESIADHLRRVIDASAPAAEQDRTLLLAKRTDDV